jgi:hypothetical protein
MYLIIPAGVFSCTKSTTLVYLALPMLKLEQFGFLQKFASQKNLVCHNIHTISPHKGRAPLWFVKNKCLWIGTILLQKLSFEVLRYP